jgi:hypothetical protein
LNRRYQRTATTITSAGNRNPANPDVGGSHGRERVNDFTAQVCLDLANAQRNGAIWSHILRDQLDVTEDVFWNCVRSGVTPARGKPEAPTAEPIPAEVVHLLITRVGLTEPDVARMTKDQAIARLNQHWAVGS